MNYHSFQRRRLAADTNIKATPGPLWPGTPLQLSHHSVTTHWVVSAKSSPCFRLLIPPWQTWGQNAQGELKCCANSQRKLANSLSMSRSWDSRHSPKGPESGNQGKFWHYSGSNFLCLGQLFRVERFSNFSWKSKVGKGLPSNDLGPLLLISQQQWFFISPQA